MSNQQVLVVLGAQDPEMLAIEALLDGADQQWSVACGADGKRVHPGIAYKATHAGPHDPSQYDEVVFVECDGEGLRQQCRSCKITVVDHHRLGDPGYGKPPEEYMSASSVGQVFLLLKRQTENSRWDFQDGRWVVQHGGPDVNVVYPAGHQLMMVAAADHCLEAAYRGKCPGVDPDQLMQWRAETRAAFQKRSVADVLIDVGAARKILRNAKTEAGFADLRGPNIPELPEAAVREGIPFLADVTDRDGRKKCVLQAAPPELVQRFLAGELVPGLTGYYGDPARGLAGGYYS